MRIHLSLFQTVFISILILLFAGCASKEELIAKYLEQAKTHISTGNIDKAKIELKNVLQLDSDSIAAWTELVKIHEIEKEWHLVYKYCRQITEKDPRNINALLKLAALYQTTNEKSLLNETMTKLEAIEPDNAGLLAIKGFIAVNEKNYSQAIEFAYQSLRKNPRLVDAYYVLVKERMANQDFSGAIAILDKALKQDADNFQLITLKLTVLETMGALNEAEVEVKHLIKRFPQNIDLKKTLFKFYINHQMFDQAEALMKQSVKEHPDNVGFKLMLVALKNKHDGQAVALQLLKSFSTQTPKEMDLHFAELDLYPDESLHLKAKEKLDFIINHAENVTDVLKAKTTLASIYLSERNYDQAKAILKDVLKQESRNEDALLLQGNIDITHGAYEKAIAEVREILKDAPFNSKALLLLANAHELIGQTSLAEEYFIDAKTFSQDAPFYTLKLVEFLLRQNTIDRAELTLTDMLKLHPDNHLALNILADIKIKKQDWIGAKSIAEQMMQNPNLTKDAEMIMGNIEAAQMNFNASEATFKGILNQHPDDQVALTSLIKLYGLTNREDEGIRYLDERLSQHPNNVTLMMLKGQLLEKKQSIKDAIKVYESLLEKDSLMVVAYEQLAKIYINNQDFLNAQAVLDKAARSRSQSYQLDFMRGNLYELTGQYEKAITTYEAILKYSPDSLTVINNLASLLTDYRNDKASIDKAYQLSLRLKNTQPAFMQDTVGWAAFKAGKLDEAIFALEKAVKLSPNEALYAYHLGLVYKQSLKIAEAKKSFENALANVKKGDAVTADEIKKEKEAL